MTSLPEFLDPYVHGFARMAVAVPRNRVADPEFNARYHRLCLIDPGAALRVSL